MRNLDEFPGKAACRYDVPFFRRVAKAAEKYLRAYKNQLSWKGYSNGKHSIPRATSMAAPGISGPGVVSIRTETPDRNLSVLASQARIGIKRRLVRSLSAQSIAMILRIVVQLGVVPVLMWGWGTAIYADWLILFSAASALSVLDFGMQTYFGNVILFAWSRQDESAYRRSLATSMGIYAGISVAAVLLLMLGDHFISWKSVFRIHAMDASSVRLTWILLALSTIALVPLGPQAAIYRARGDYDRSTALTTAWEVLRGIGLCIVVARDGSPIAAGAVFVGVSGITWVVLVYDQRTRYGELRLAMAVPTFGELKATVSKAAFYVIFNIAGPIVQNGTMVLLGVLGATPAAIIAFSVARTLTGVVRQVVLSLANAAGGELSRLHCLHDGTALRRLFNATSRLTIGAGGLLGGIVLLIGAPFIRTWTYGEVFDADWLVRIFVLTVVLSSPSLAAFTLFNYTNRPTILALSSALFAIGAIASCFVLVRPFSAPGAAAGVGLAEWLAVGLLIPFAACNELALPYLSYLRNSYTIAAFGLGVGYVVAWCLAHMVRNQTLLGIVELGALWSVFISVPAFFILFGREERRWLFRAVLIHLRA
jgi:O-antigen/teichoic acid export membrane protein